MNNFLQFAKANSNLIEHNLQVALSDYKNNFNAELMSAVEYSVLNGGKRIRPLLVLATFSAFDVDYNEYLNIANAIEFIHCYSLIHDDLPAMDNDDLRRGKPTLHKAYDEATAILAGDLLQALAFNQLCKLKNISAEQALKLIIMLSEAAGCNGMVTGQALDMQAIKKTISLQQLNTIHKYKTGALLSAAILMPLSLITNSANASDEMQKFADNIGLLFQVKDDLLDVTSDSATLGKTAGIDSVNQKATYPSLLGLEQAKAKAKQLHTDSICSLNKIGLQNSYLRALADYIFERNH